MLQNLFLLVIDDLASIIVSATTFSITTLSIIVFVCDTQLKSNEYNDVIVDVVMVNFVNVNMAEETCSVRKNSIIDKLNLSDKSATLITKLFTNVVYSLP